MRQDRRQEGRCGVPIRRRGKRIPGITGTAALLSMHEMIVSAALRLSNFVLHLIR